MPMNDCIYYNKHNSRCKIKNALVTSPRTKCNPRCYSFDANTLHIKNHKEIVWIDTNTTINGFIGGILFFKIEHDKHVFKVIPTIPTFCTKVCDTLLDSMQFADQIMTQYIRRIINE